MQNKFLILSLAAATSFGALSGCSTRKIGEEAKAPLPREKTLQPSTEGGGDSTAAPAPAGPAPIRCDLPATLTPEISMTMQTYFASVTAQYRNLSRSERDARFVDRDVKGNVLHHSELADPTETPKTWAHKDLSKDNIPGTSTERAYAELGLKTEGAPIVVAVIDSAIDVQHEDLKNRIVEGGGWNFLGGKDGSKVYHTTLEVTRELKRMRLRAARPLPLTPAEQAYLTELEAAYAKGMGEAAEKLKIRTDARDQLKTALDVLRELCQIKEGTYDEVKAIRSDNAAVIAARDTALISLEKGRDLNWYKSSIDHWAEAVQLGTQYYYNLEFDPSAVVGDNPAEMIETYGNADVTPVVDAEHHGTHVAGIIGAERGNSIGMDGQADHVRILPLRAVPDGDERDKDVGNAIRYAADHGARVINMSFGKTYSPHRQFVWDSLKYAVSKNVLIVHAAGNASENNDLRSHYPDREVRDQDRNLVETIGGILEVGASTKWMDEKLAASFSDYGARTVDLFAPGEEILSTVSGEVKYEPLSGTSMASPEVAGVAALVLSQFPQLTAEQVKKVILDTVNPAKDHKVLLPSVAAGPGTLVDFGTLSRTGGLLNAYEALKAAAQL